MAGPADAALAAGDFRRQRCRHLAVGFIEGAVWCVDDPVLRDGVVNGGIYPIVVAQALKPFPQATGRAAALQNTLQLGLCFLTSLLVSALIATPLLTTTSVMLVDRAGRAGLSHAASQREPDYRIVARINAFQQ
jgi:hypothetical protein